MVTAPPLPTVIFHALALLTGNLSPTGGPLINDPIHTNGILSALLVSHWGLRAFGSASVVSRLHDSGCRQHRDGWASFHVRLPNSASGEWRNTSKIPIRVPLPDVKNLI